jgi:hypothetical protein
MDVRISASHDIGDDLLCGVRRQPPTVYLAADMAERFDRRRVSDRDLIAIARTKSAPSRLGQTCLAMRQEVGRDLSQRGDDGLSTQRHLNASLGGEPLRPTDMAVFPHIDNSLLVGIDTKVPEPETILGRMPGGPLFG